MNEVEMQPDPVDYGEWKNGVNTAGTLSAVNGFVGKVGMAIASSVGAAMLQFGGFDATQTIQTVTAQHLSLPCTSGFRLSQILQQLLL